MRTENVDTYRGINQGRKVGTFKRDLMWAKDNWKLYAMILPGFLFTFLFAYLPMFGIIIAFKKVNFRDGIFGSEWVGLSNFYSLFRNDSVWDSIRNTLAYNVVFIISGLIISVALAIFLSMLKNKFLSKVYQTIYIMPHFLSMVIVAYLVYAFLSMESGFINNQLNVMIFGEKAQKVNWYAKPNAWPIILFIVRVWKTAGYNSIVYLAAIAGIDAELYEAAEIDGAGIWRKIRHVTLPSLKTMMIIMTILAVGGIFTADFGLFYTVTMNSGVLYPTTLVTNTFIYNLMTDAGTASTGMSSAASMLQSIVGFVMVVVTNMIVRRIDEESSLF